MMLGGGGSAFSIVWDRVGQLVASFGASEADRGSGMDPDGGSGTATGSPDEPASGDDTDRGSIMDPDG